MSGSKPIGKGPKAEVHLERSAKGKLPEAAKAAIDVVKGMKVELPQAPKSPVRAGAGSATFGKKELANKILAPGSRGETSHPADAIQKRMQQPGEIKLESFDIKRKNSAKAGDLGKKGEGGVPPMSAERPQPASPYKKPME